jgi:hypothetical protein
MIEHEIDAGTTDAFDVRYERLDIIRMAREAGFERVVAIHSDGSKTVTVAPVPELEAFAALVAAAEREACAKLLDEMAAQDKHSNYYVVAAKAIRTRSKS